MRLEHNDVRLQHGASRHQTESDILTPEEIEAELVYEDTILTAEKGHGIVEKEHTPVGLYSAELGEGGKEQQDSLAVFTIEKEDGEKVTWMIVADGVSNSKDGAYASRRLVEVIQQKLKSGSDIKAALLQVAQEFSDDIQIALTSHKAKGGKKLLIDVQGSNEENPLYATTLVAVQLKENGKTTAYRLGDGQVYISRATNRSTIEKMDKGEIFPVDFTKEQEIYNNPIERRFRSVSEGSLRGSINLVDLYSQGKIELGGRTEQLKSELDKILTGTSIDQLPIKVQDALNYFAESPEQQVNKIKEIDLGELKPGDIVIVCSDGIENNILSQEIQKIFDFAIQKSDKKTPDPNLIRTIITREVQKIMNGQIARDYAKPDNFSIIVYVQTEEGIQMVEVDEGDRSEENAA